MKSLKKSWMMIIAFAVIISGISGLVAPKGSGGFLAL